MALHNFQSKSKLELSSTWDLCETPSRSYTIRIMPQREVMVSYIDMSSVYYPRLVIWEPLSINVGRKDSWVKLQFAEGPWL